MLRIMSIRSGLCFGLLFALSALGCGQTQAPAVDAMERTVPITAVSISKDALQERHSQQTGFTTSVAQVSVQPHASKYKSILHAPANALVERFELKRGIWRSVQKKELSNGDEFFFQGQLHAVHNASGLISIKPLEIKQDEIHAASAIYHPEIKIRVPTSQDVVLLTGSELQSPGHWRLKDVFDGSGHVWFRGYRFDVRDSGVERRQVSYTGHVRA